MVQLRLGGDFIFIEWVRRVVVRVGRWTSGRGVRLDITSYYYCCYCFMGFVDGVGWMGGSMDQWMEGVGVFFFTWCHFFS